MFMFKALFSPAVYIINIFLPGQKLSNVRLVVTKLSNILVALVGFLVILNSSYGRFRINLLECVLFVKAKYKFCIL
jgi:hypothetical protein